MPIFSRMVFQAMKWAARRGLRDDELTAVEGKKRGAVQTGVRGETYAYWYLRQRGYIFVARNYTPARTKGEIDLVGYDGETLAFVEVRTRTIGKTRVEQGAQPELAALPELSVTPEKQKMLAQTARLYLSERHVRECPCRFDVVAIDNEPGRIPVVRLHKDAFSPQM